MKTYLLISLIVSLHGMELATYSHSESKVDNLCTNETTSFSDLASGGMNYIDKESDDLLATSIKLSPLIFAHNHVCHLGCEQLGIYLEKLSQDVHAHMSNLSTMPFDEKIDCLKQKFIIDQAQAKNFCAWLKIKSTDKK